MQFKHIQKNPEGYQRIDTTLTTPYWCYWLGFGRKLTETRFDVGSDKKRVITYHENGQEKDITEQSADGKRNGKFWLYEEDGKLLEVAHYKDNVLNGSRILYQYNANNAEISDEHLQHYTAGKRTGHWVSVRDAKVTMAESFYKDDGSEFGFRFNYDFFHGPLSFKALCGEKEIRVSESGSVTTTHKEGETLPGKDMEERREIYRQAVGFMDETCLKKISELQSNGFKEIEALENRSATKDMLSKKEQEIAALVEKVKQNFDDFRAMIPVEFRKSKPGDKNTLN